MTDLEIIINAILYECDKVVKIINDDLHPDSLWFYEDVSKQRSWKRKFSMLMGGDAWDEEIHEALHDYYKDVIKLKGVDVVKELDGDEAIITANMNQRAISQALTKKVKEYIEACK